MQPADPDEIGPERWPSGEHCILLFNTIHDVLKTEKLLKSRGIWHDMIPTPRQYSTDCGMALKANSAEAGAVSQLLAERRIAHQLRQIE